MSANLPVRRRAKQSSKNSNFSLYLIGGVLLLLIVFVIGLNIWNSRPTVSAQPLDIQDGWVDRNSIGNPDAKVVVEAYEDFLCPHCAEFTAQVEPRLIDEYVKTGKVRFVYHTFPLQGFEPGASIAANAAMCAADQNQFWQMHDQLFASQTRGMSAFEPEALTKTAEALGMNGSQFAQCLNSLKYGAEVRQTVNDGIALGVQGTPTIFVNGVLLSTGADYTSLKAQIDKLLGSAG